MKIKTVGILGLGALGILYGESLQRVLGDDLYILVDNERKKRYEKEGVYSNQKKINFNFLSYDRQEEIELDFIIVALKAYHLEESLEQISPFVGEKTIFLSVMNGIDSEECIGKYFGEEKILYGVAQGMDATREGRSLIYTQKGNISIGEKSGEKSERILKVIDLFDEAGIQWNMPESILHQMWNKLMLNTGINQVLALQRGRYRDFQQDEKTRKLVLEVMEEVKTIANKKGILLTQKDIDQWKEILDRLDPDLKPSMAQDVEAGRKTEVEYFSEKICRLGRELGIPTPLNDEIYQKLKD